MKTVSKMYKLRKDLLFDFALQAIKELGYKFDRIDKNSGLITFETGLSWKSWAGQQISVMILEHGNSAEISISGVRKQTGVIVQLYDWGEAKSIANKIIQKIDDRARKSGVQKETHFSNTRYANPSTSLTTSVDNALTRIYPRSYSIRRELH